YIPIIKDVFKQRGLPEDLVYIAFIESNCSTTKVTPAKTNTNPFQISAYDAERWGLKVIPGSIDERKDPLKAARAVAEIVSEIYDETYTWTPAVRDESHRWGWAILGYNLGIDQIKLKYKDCDGYIGKYIKSSSTSESQKEYLQKFYAAKDSLSDVQLEEPSPIIAAPLIYKKKPNSTAYDVHRVKSGDTLTSIANGSPQTLHRIVAFTMEQYAEMNQQPCDPNNSESSQLFDPNNPQIGQTVFIPRRADETINFSDIQSELHFTEDQTQKFKDSNQHLGDSIINNAEGVRETTLYFTSEEQKTNFYTAFQNDILPFEEASRKSADTDLCFVHAGRAIRDSDVAR
ncbi:MAG: lytic transglycosylase, partial [Candidatus Gracilibacteria bacterium]